MKNVILLGSLILSSAPGLLLAQTAPAEGVPPQGNWPMWVPIVFIFVVFYFLMFRPQQKQQKQHQATLKALKRGDDVVTASGIHGRISSVTDQTVMLEIADNVRIKVAKAQIAQILTPSVPEGKK